ncbi:MAG: hypothetical protein H7263_16870 [Candidatus Sericytochromatia bacterium]|nr:hypothetical protein [Candidatus Sericytochromatia bacterium]
MSKKFLISLISFLLIFTDQSQVFAQTNSMEQIAKQNTYTIDKNIFFIAEKSDTSLSIKDVDHTSKLWMASLFIPGAGQALMGDEIKGAGFFVLEIGLFVSMIAINALLGGKLFSNPQTNMVTSTPANATSTPDPSSTPNPPPANDIKIDSPDSLRFLIYLSLFTAAIATHIWNIYDSYLMSEDVSKKITISNGTIAFKAFVF